jgi:putative endopeptidase
MLKNAIFVVVTATALSCGPKQTPTGGGGGGDGDGTATTGGGGGGGGGGEGSANGGNGAGTAATPRPANAVDVSLADVGLEAGSLDRKADPCVDFYQFACGGWLAKNPIPADRARWARFSELDDRNESTLRKIVEDAAAGKLGSDASDAIAKKLGDHYASCMDEKTIESRGTAGIKPLLDVTAKVTNDATWMKAVIALHRVKIAVLWGLAVEPDFKDSTKNLLYLDTAGLGLPDRDYYFEDKFKDKVEAYRAHLGRAFEAIGQPADKAKTAADDVVAIEVEIARLTKTGVERRDIPALYNPLDRKGLKKAAKSVDWNGYFKALGFDPGKKVIVTTPKFFQGIDGLRKQFKPAQWSSYFTYHVVSSLALALPKKIDDEMFALRKALSGVEKQRDRYKRCVDSVDQAMPELLGQPFVKRAFPGESKTAAGNMVDAIAKSLGNEIDVLSWMSEPTKKMARAKLAKLAKLIGYPDKWKTYDFAVKRDDFAGNVLRASEFDARRDRRKAGKPYDRNEWLMPAYLVNAYYNPLANNTGLPAGILQPPFFGIDRSVAANLGGIGMVIGHELTHGFDDQGAQFDENGNLKNWWQEGDLKEFSGRGKCVAAQYSTFEALPKQFVKGDLTLGENIADMGGVKMAFRAYRDLRKNADKVYIADGFTEDQQYFIAVAQAWCSKDRKEEALQRLTTDVHSPPKFRVYGALRNLPEFAAAFSCPAGTPMAPADRCSVW